MGAMTERLQRLGGFLAAMVVPNIAAIIAWGLITALFIPTGWLPNEKFALLVGPMIRFLLPLLIGYTGGKLVYAWAVRGSCDAGSIKSNTFTIEWPLHSGKFAEFPEVDRADWFGIPQATEKLLSGQRGFLEELLRVAGSAG